jgi:hypothetical protein
MTSNLCKYAKDCPVYLGKIYTSVAPLPIYKNVFCNRGFKGWNNCEQFMEYKMNDLAKSK